MQMAGQNSVRMAVSEPCRLSAYREFTEERQETGGMYESTYTHQCVGG
jgi:hypothetical protein